MRSRLTLSGKIIVLTLVALVLGLSLFSILAVQSVNASVRNILDERLDIAKIVAHHLDETISFLVVDQQFLATTNFSLLNRQGFDDTATSIKNVFSQFKISAGAVYAIDPDGIVIQTESSDSAELGAVVPVYPDMKKNLESGKPAISGLVGKPLSDTPVVLICTPIMDANHKLVCSIASSIAVIELGINPLLENIEVGNTGYVEVVDNKGFVLVRTNPGSPPSSFEFSDHPKRFADLILSDQAMVGKCHVCHSPSSSVPISRDILAFAPLSTVPWGIAIRQSETEALFPTRQLEGRLLILGSLLVLITLAVVVVMMQSIIKPIKMLKNAANKLAVYDYDATVPINRGDEIGQLSKAFQDMRSELKKSRSQLVSRYHEAKQREQLRGRLFSRVIVAQEQERLRIARELHDEYGQTLTGLLMTIESVEATLPPGQERLKERLAKTKEVVSHAIGETRRLILDLRPSALDELGLAKAVKTLAQQQLGENDIDVNVEIHGLNNRLPSPLEITLFRITQEAIHNIIKHAKAHQVKITLSQNEQNISAIIQDDGQGFDPNSLLENGLKNKSWGIAGMKERTELMGGTFVIKTGKRQGTSLEITIPLDQRLWGDTNLTQPDEEI